MTYIKDDARQLLNEMHVQNRLSYHEYSTLFDALDEIETVRDRDKELEELWGAFGDIPMNPETECIEEKFLGFDAGTDREEIWHWFDERYSKGVAALLYGG